MATVAEDQSASRTLLILLFLAEKKITKPKKKGRTRIRTGVVRIKTESDNHYTIQPGLF